MELDMAKEKHSDDKISEGTLHEILLDIKYRLDHLEDIEADNRALIVKLIKQSNSVVRFLANIDIEPIEDQIDDSASFSKLKEEKFISSDRIKEIKELVDEFMVKHKDLKELEAELKKNKVMLTPGEIGEA